MQREQPTAGFDDLATVARRVRRTTLGLIYHAGSGHPGGSLSAVDLLVYLYTRELRINAQCPDWPERDRFVLSKGHACPALYAIAAEVGLVPSQQLLEFRKLGGALQGHPSVASTPWVETSTGSLGQGFSAAIGMALGLRYLGSPARVYVMLGDGEMQVGEVWEGAMCAGHYRLGNLCAILDYNKLQSDDFNENIMGLEPLRTKWEAFRWQVLEIDGHAFDQMASALATARSSSRQPTLIIAHTIKGKGVTFMEGVAAWHGSVRLRAEELRRALVDLDTPSEEIERYLDGTIWQHNI